MNAAGVWLQTNGEVTKAYYRALDSHGPAGQIATALFRANKRSAAAKRYRGGRYRGAAYDVKDWSVGEACRLLSLHADALNIKWGWKRDDGQAFHSWVLYVDLPGGQVSFHAASRGSGPEYHGEWSGLRNSTEIICAYCDSVRPDPEK